MGTTAEKLTYLNTTKGLIKDTINYTGAGITNETFRQYPSILYNKYLDILKNPNTLFNNMPQVTGTGTSLVLNNTADTKMKMILNPNLTQDANPTPSSPQTIHTITGDNTIIISNSDNAQSQNLTITLDNLEYCKIGNYADEFYKTSGSNLLNIDNSESGGIDSSGNEVSGTALWRGNEYILVKPNTQYVLSTTNSMTLRLYEYSESKTFISPRAEAAGNSLTITTGNNTKYLRWSIYNGGNTITSNDAKSFNLMLNKGSTALEYEPYGINKWCIKKNIGKVVLKGSGEYWSATSTPNVYYTNSIPNINSSLPATNELVYCDNYMKTYRSNMQNLDYCCALAGGNICIKNKDISNATDLATWLSTHNTIMYYPLAIPTFTLLNDILQAELNNIENALLSYQSQTNISQTNDDLPFILDVVAIQKNAL